MENVLLIQWYQSFRNWQWKEFSNPRKISAQCNCSINSVFFAQLCPDCYLSTSIEYILHEMNKIILPLLFICIQSSGNFLGIPTLPSEYSIRPPSSSFAWERTFEASFKHFRKLYSPGMEQWGPVYFVLGKHNRVWKFKRNTWSCSGNIYWTRNSIYRRIL